MFSYFLLPLNSCAVIDIYISNLHFNLTLIMTSKNGHNIKSMKISHVRSQIKGFFVFQFHSDTSFWPQLLEPNAACTKFGVTKC